jgi:predicted secreted protein
MRLEASRGVLLSLCLLFAAIPARAETVLKLAETATLHADPDELAAELRAEASARTAADAQAAVNQAMRRALDQAKAIADVTAATGSYSVWLEGSSPPPGRPATSGLWHATQTLQLTSQNGPVLLNLLGSLQAQGLAAGQLAWRLSEQKERTVKEEATRRAVQQLRGRAEQIAGLLGLTFGSFREVSLTPEPQPRSLLAMRTVEAAAPGFPEPSAEPGPIPVSATVQAEVLLQPPPAAGGPSR